MFCKQSIGKLAALRAVYIHPARLRPDDTMERLLVGATFYALEVIHLESVGHIDYLNSRRL